MDLLWRKVRCVCKEGGSTVSDTVYTQCYFHSLKMDISRTALECWQLCICLTTASDPQDRNQLTPSHVIMIATYRSCSKVYFWTLTQEWRWAEVSWEITISRQYKWAERQAPFSFSDVTWPDITFRLDGCVVSVEAHRKISITFSVQAVEHMKNRRWPPRNFKCWFPALWREQSKVVVLCLRSLGAQHCSCVSWTSAGDGANFPPDLDKSRQVQSRCSQMLRDPPRIFQSGATPDLSSPPLRTGPGICHFQ